MRRILLSWIVFFGLVGDARADGAAWTVARRALPANPRFVVRADLRATLDMPVVKSWLEDVSARSPWLKEGRARLRTTCGLDPYTVIAEVVGIQDAAGGAIMYFSTPGLTRAAFATCAAKLGLQISEAGRVVAVSKPGGGTVYLAWPAPEVIAIAAQPEKREQLEGLLSGKGLAAGSPVSMALAGVDTGAWLWGVGAAPPGNDEVVAVRTSARRAGGKIVVAVHLTSPSAEKSGETMKVFTAKLTELRARQDLPPALARALAGIEMSAKDAEISARATVEEAALPGLLAFAGLSAPPSGPPDPRLAAVQGRWQRAGGEICPAGGRIKGGPYPRTTFCVDAGGIPQGPGLLVMTAQGKRVYVDVAHCAGRRCGAWTAWTEGGERVAAWSFDAKGSDTRTFTAPGWEQFPTPPPPPPPPAPRR